MGTAEKEKRRKGEKGKTRKGEKQKRGTAEKKKNRKEEKGKMRKREEQKRGKGEKEKRRKRRNGAPVLVDFSFSLTIIFVAHCEMGWILNEFMDDRGVFIDNYDS